MNPAIPFIDLAAQQKKIRPEIEKAIQTVLEHGSYIMGPEIETLEKRLADFTKAKHVISCADGTVALSLSLMAKQVKANQAVIVPNFTFAATAETVALAGAIPLFVDIDPNTFNISANSLKLGIQKAKELNLDLVGIIAVDLFGQTADYDILIPIAEDNNLWIIADAAQSFGATYKGKYAGNIVDLSTTSFFPAKPLGCYGDGGAIFTNDDKIADTLKSLRLHGKGQDPYEYIHIGLNGRLDTIQAAILLEKLKIFPQECKLRNTIANYYSTGLNPLLKKPIIADSLESVWAQYTLTLPSYIDRRSFIHALKIKGIPTMIYYPIPLDQQIAYAHFPKVDDLSISHTLCNQVLSLPMHPYLEKFTQDFIINSVNSLVDSFHP